MLHCQDSVFKINQCSLKIVSYFCISGCTANNDCVHLTMPELALRGESTNLSCTLGTDALDSVGSINWYFQNSTDQSNGPFVYNYNLGTKVGTPQPGFTFKVSGSYEEATKTHILTILNVTLGDEENWRCQNLGPSACNGVSEDGVLMVNGKHNLLFQKLGKVLFYFWLPIFTCDMLS